MTLAEEAALLYRLAFREGNGSGTVWVATPGFPDPRSRIPTIVDQIGTLHISTGMVIACDPTWAWDTAFCPPFTERFPRGDWPVLRCVGTVTLPSGQQTPLCLGALVRFSNEEPIVWQMARYASEDRKELEEDEYVGYGVDAGVACFMDAAALPAFGWLMNTVDNPADQLDELMGAFEAERMLDVPVTTEAGETANVVLFPSGGGDGRYPCFIGYDQHGVVCTLLTHFFLFDATASRANAQR